MLFLLKYFSLLRMIDYIQKKIYTICQEFNQNTYHTIWEVYHEKQAVQQGAGI